MLKYSKDRDRIEVIRAKPWGQKYIFKETMP